VIEDARNTNPKFSFILLLLVRTSPLCSVYTYKEKKYDHNICRAFITHVKTATCFGCTYVAIIRLDIGP